MSVIHGRDVNIYNAQGNVVIAASKSCVIRKTSAVHEVANPNSSTSVMVKPGRTQWSASMSHLVTTNKGGIPLVGQMVIITYKVNGNSTFRGTALVSDAEITSTIGNLSQGSIKLTGSGDLEEL